MNPIGACIWSLPGECFQDQLDIASACGLDGVQLDLYSGDGELTLSSDEMIEVCLKRRETTGLTYPSLGIGVFCERAATDPREHPFLRGVLDAAIDAAIKLEIPLLQIPAFGASALRTDEDIANTADLMRYACQQAEGAGVLVGSENVLPVEPLDLLINQVGMPNFKIYFDTANPHAMAGLSAIELLESSLEHVVQVHLKDELDDGQPALLGEGDTGFTETLAYLKQVGYDGWYVFESPYSKVMRIRGISAQKVLEMDLRSARQ